MRSALLCAALAVSASAADAPKAAAKTEAPKPAAAANKPAAAPKPAAASSTKESAKKEDENSVYSIGYLMGRNVAPFNLTPSELNILAGGLADAASGKPAKVDVRFYQSRINDMLSKRMEGAAAKEKEKGKAYVEKFVKENKPQPIPGGGWYLETAAGTGPIPGKTDTIKAHYRGVTVEGQQFDSSYDRGAPTEFALNGVIACWTNGISMMKVGGKAKLVCPSDVAYGDPGRPGIKPGATLIFDVELVEIVATAPAPAPAPAKKK